MRSRINRSRSLVRLVGSGLLFAAAGANAQDVLDPLEGIGTLEGLTVIGSTEDVFALPGSGYYVDEEELRSQNYTNPNRVLARVPGVYVREEGGYGLFPNISIRGGDGTRSEKVTIMEDGIMIVPAPYSSPAAYFSPQVARMSGMEVLKGSSQVRYGPQTTGGVINYLSTQVPTDHNFYTRNLYGTDNAITSQTYYGDVIENDHGRFGYVLEFFFNRADGFRTIDPAAGYGGSDNTGFSVIEPMVKFFWEPNSALKQRFEFKYGFTDFDADESYTGLTEADVRATPDRRYAATRFDNMSTQQHRTYFKWLIEPADGLSFETALYFNQFERNWRKLDELRNIPGFAAGDVATRNALLSPAGVAALQGRGAGDLVVRSNAREYSAYGIQLAGQWDFATGPVEHSLGFGTRYHRDYVERDQFDDIYNQNATGAIAGRQYRLDNVRRQESDALAIWIEDEISFGNLTVTPGLRYEHVSFTQIDGTENKAVVGSLAALAANRAAVTFAETNSSIDELMPGISFAYDFDGVVNLFGGVHKGISIPGPRANIQGTGVEESIGYELGARYNRENFSAELVGFLTDFDNILNTNAGFGGGFSSTNGGQAEVWGFESIINYDPLAGAEVELPMYVSATWTSAEFQNPIAGGGADNIYGGAGNGSDIPYIPEWQVAAGIGVRTAKWGANLDMTYNSSSFGTARNLSAPGAVTSTAGAREGKIDQLLLFDFSANYSINENLTLLAGVANILDERAIVSRIPRGPRANNGRTAYIGFESRF